MILIDNRVGSRELLSLIHGVGVQAELAGHLSTDFQFEGCGPDGPVLVGFERKEIRDLLTSMRDNRLAGSQVGHMIEAYDVCYLVVEGYWRCGPASGLVELPGGGRGGGNHFQPARGSIRFSELSRFLASLRELGGLRIWRTFDIHDTARYLVEEWHWWQKPWDEHKTHRTLYSPDAPRPRVGHKPRIFRTEAPLKEHWLARLPRIDARAEALSQYFVSARDLANAPVERWEAIAGIGKKTAALVVEEINKQS